MNILLSNDDGIFSNGILRLADELSKNNNVLLIAPDGNRSATAHSLSIGKAVKLKEHNLSKNYKAYSLSGTPCDCIKFAKLHFNNFNADVVVSGINKAHNLGSDILYSGTVAIACEAAFFNHVAFAFSAFNYGDSDFELYSKYAVKIINELLPVSKPGDIWNVNFPDTENKTIQGIKITKLGKQLYSDRYEKVGDNEFVLVGELLDHNENDADCDIEWIKKGYITVTPLLFNKTNYAKLNLVKDVFD